MAATRATALCQLIAARKGVQNEVHQAFTELHRDTQKVPLLSGFTKTYRKINEEDADLPGESQRIVLRLADSLTQMRELKTRLWDLTATVDATNCAARGDVVVDGQVVLENVPVSTLLFLEKQLLDVGTFIEKLPTLDPSESWAWDPNASAYAAERTTTVRSKKVPRNHELAPATPQHPAQVQVWHEDVPVGYWDTIRFSAAIPADRKHQLVARVSALREAVKMAREQANMTAVDDAKIASKLFDHILAE